MTDTNQLPTNDLTGTQALWPQMIKALAEIDRALGLPDDGCNSLAQTLEAIRALQALAQVQGEPVGMVQVGWQQRYICQEEGPSSWQDTCSATAAILAKKANHEVRATYAFSTTPQPSQATQAGVTDEQVAKALESVGVELQRFMGGISGNKDVWTTAGSQSVRRIAKGVRAILSLRPAAVPMTGEQRVVVSFLLGEGDLNGASFGDPHNPTHGGQFWWRKYLRNAFGITAQAKKEGA